MIRVAATAMISRVVTSPRACPRTGKVERIAWLPAAVCTATVTM
jgi:hypothetical protein